MSKAGFGVVPDVDPAAAFMPTRELSEQESAIEADPDSWENLENTEVPKDLQADLDSGAAAVLYWRALIMPVRPQKRSRGGIIIVEESRENAQYLTYIGKIVALGPLWCKGPNFQSEEGLPELKPGDWVLYGRHAGQRVEYRGVKFLLVNDDDKLMKVKGPEGWRIYL